MPAFLSKPANVLTVTLVLVVVGILSYIGATTLVRPVRAGSADDVTAGQVRQALSLCGLSAKPLAAAGLQPAQVTSVVSNARNYLANSGAAFRTAIDSYRSESLQVQKLERLVKTGQASGQTVSALAAHRQALASAAAAKATAVDALFAAATSGLASPSVQALTNIRANTDRPTPVEFKVTNRSEEGWLALREALANDRISTRLVQDPDPARHQYVLEARADSAVSSAQTGLANLAAVRTAWSSAVGN